MMPFNFDCIFGYSVVAKFNAPTFFRLAEEEKTIFNG